MRITIATPVHGDVKALYSLSLSRMLLTTIGEWPRRMKGVPLRIEVNQYHGTVIGISREQLLNTAVSIGSDWILWLDADQTFPPDTLLRLMAHGVPVVGANYPMRGGSSLPTASVRQGDKVVPVYSTPEKVAAGLLEPVDYMGLGVCLVSLEAIREAQRPLFYSMVEDGYFFDRLREIGVHPMVDHALSARVGHIDSHVLTNASSLATMGSELSEGRISGGYAHAG